MRFCNKHGQVDTIFQPCAGCIDEEAKGQEAFKAELKRLEDENAALKKKLADLDWINKGEDRRQKKRAE